MQYSTSGDAHSSPIRHSPRLRRLGTATAIALAAGAALIGQASAEDKSNALVEALVRKGVLTDKEAAAIQEDLSKDIEASSANKVKLSDSITELRLYGDLRLRYQYDNKDLQANPAGVGVNNDLEARSPSGNQQSRWRFRLRLNADFKLGPDFFGGVELQTAQASDSGMQTFENGFDDYNIFISKAYLGWNATDWLTVIAGKVPNPFYTTDLIWDTDINPTGLVESIQFHQLFATTEEGGYSKDGKTVLPSKTVESKWELTLNAGQFIFDDNIEGGGSDNGATRDNDSTTDAYLFQTQLVGSYKFGKDLKVTLAPGWLTYINGSLGGLQNANAFQDNANVSGATRNLNLLLLPGDVAFKVAGIKTKLLWDFSYNIEGRKRVEDIYDLVSLRGPTDDGITDPDDFDKGHSPQDNIAFLIGLQFGENKKQGDFSFLANYRQTGLGAVDPNLNDSDFAASELNTRG
jgi:polyhydroxyalkanoate synthesis regulator phasin